MLNLNWFIMVLFGLLLCTTLVVCLCLVLCFSVSGVLLFCLLCNCVLGL